MTLVEHVGRQLIEEGKFGKDEGICPHLLKKKSQRCGAPLSLVKDQFGGTIGRKKKACDLVAFLLQPQMWTFPCLLHDEVCFMVKFCLYFIMKDLTDSLQYILKLSFGQEVGLGLRSSIRWE
jgi:hypothetical protein